MEQELKNLAEEERAHSLIIREELEMLLLMPYQSNLSMEDIRIFDEYNRQAIQMVDSLTPVRFNTAGIDSKIRGITEVLRIAKSDGGSGNTLSRCFAGIAYGLSCGHKDILSNTDEEAVVRRREEMLGRYMALRFCPENLTSTIWRLPE